MNESNHFLHSRSVLVKLSFFPFHPTCISIHRHLHRNGLSAYSLSIALFSLHYRCWGKQLPDLLQHITIQHGKLKLLPTLLSEPQLTLTGPPQLGLNLSRSN